MAANVKEAFAGRLIADATVADLADEVVPQLNTQEPGSAYVVYTVLGSTGQDKTDGAATLRRYQIQADCYAPTEAEATALAAAVTAAVGPGGGWVDKEGAGVHGTFTEDTSNGVTDDGVRVETRIFGVWFKPTA